MKICYFKEWLAGGSLVNDIVKGATVQMFISETVVLDNSTELKARVWIESELNGVWWTAFIIVLLLSIILIFDRNNISRIRDLKHLWKAWSSL